MQKWLVDQYDSASEITESRFDILDGLGVLQELEANRYGFKDDEDMPSLTGAEARTMAYALLSLGMDD